MDTINENVNFLNETVYNVYQEIADSFHKSRYSVWNYVKLFLDRAESGQKLLDAGCGNGKNMLYRPDLNATGCDTSSNLIKICSDRGLHAINANIKCLPFDNQTFDIVISIAVIHHLSTDSDRLQALKELVRVLKPGGRLLVSVWALEQKLDEKFVQIKDNDYLVSWMQNGKKINRYYHLFSESEINRMIGQLPELNVDKIVFEKDNWFIDGTKNLTK